MAMLGLLLLLLAVLLMRQTLPVTAAWDCNTTFYDIVPGFDYGPWTCENRCGESYTQLPCACDIRCHVYQDCCADFDTYCPHLSLTQVNHTKGAHSEHDSQGVNILAQNTNSSSSSISSSTEANAVKETKDFSEQFAVETEESYTDMSPTSLSILNEEQSHTPDQEIVSGFTEIAMPFTSDVRTKAASFQLKENSQAMSSASLLGLSECRHHTRLISKCPPQGVLSPELLVMFDGQQVEEEEVVYKCDTPYQQMELEDQDLIHIFPVTDSSSGFHFANVYCLLCHGVNIENAIIWQLSFIFGSKTTRKVQPPKNPGDVLKIALQQQNAKTIASPPSPYIPRRCLPSGVLQAPDCSCPVLDHHCQKGPVSLFQVTKRSSFRNPACALCYAISSSINVEEIKAPDIEMLTHVKNRMEFFTLMNWKSNPLTVRHTSMQMSTPHSSFSSFKWASMSCNLSTVPTKRDGVSSRITSKDEENGEGGGITMKEESSDHLNSVSAQRNIHSINTTGKQLREHVTAAPSAKANVESGKDTTGQSCHAYECIRHIPLVNGECRDDVGYFIMDFYLNCNSMEDMTTSITQSTQPLHSDVLANLTHNLRDKFNRKNVSFIFDEIKVLHSQDNCKWNVRISLIIDLGKVYLISETSSLRVAFVNATYEILVLAIQKQLDELTTNVEVCSNVDLFTKQLQFIPNICVFSTTYTPPKANDHLSNAMKTTCFPLVLFVMFGVMLLP